MVVLVRDQWQSGVSNFRKLYSQIDFLILVNAKFPTDTVAGKFKIAVSSNYMFDAVRFDQ